MSSICLHFLLLIVVASAMAQTFQYSRGWTNGKKRADPSLIQQQQQLMQHGHSILPVDFNSNPIEDWSRVKINDEANEDGGDRLVYSNQCAKLVTLLGSVLKNNDKTSDDPIINLH